jgi:hypothetical protein
VATELTAGIAGGVLVFSPQLHPHHSGTPAYRMPVNQLFSALASQAADRGDMLHIEVLEADPITWQVSYGSVSATEFVRVNPKYVTLPVLR